MEFREQLAIYVERTEAELNRLLPLISCPQQEVVEANRRNGAALCLCAGDDPCLFADPR